MGYSLCSFLGSMVMPVRVVNLLACLQGCFRQHWNIEIWEATHSLMCATGGK